MATQLALVAAIAASTAADTARAEGWFDFLNPRDHKTGNSPTSDSDKIVKLPAGPQDVYCPDVDIMEGGATARSGGEASSDVHYQFDISDTARECDPQGSQFALKIGVAGHLLIGPAGSPGAYSSALKVEVKRDIDGKVLFSKSYRVAADTAGTLRGSFRLVTEPIMLPLTRARLDDDYSIAVGLGGAGGGPKAAHRGHAKRTN